MILPWIFHSVGSVELNGQPAPTARATSEGITTAAVWGLTIWALLWSAAPWAGTGMCACATPDRPRRVWPDTSGSRTVCLKFHP